jgi:hypothetical protein
MPEADASLCEMLSAHALISSLITCFLPFFSAQVRVYQQELAVRGGVHPRDAGLVRQIQTRSARPLNRL